MHLLQGKGGRRNAMPARRIEVSGVSALDALAEAQEAVRP